MQTPGEVQGSAQVPEKVWESLVQSQVRFNRVSESSGEGCGEGSGEVVEKVPEKVLEALVQSQVRFNSVPEKVPAWCGQVQRGFKVGSGEMPGVCRRSCSAKFQQISDEKTCEHNLLLLLGIPPKLTETSATALCGTTKE